MRLGAHLSIARGLRWTASEAVRLRCECLQIFVSNPRGWRRGPLPPDEEIAALRETMARHHIAPLICHSSYLVNLASPDTQLWRKSLDAAAADMRTATVLGSDRFVVPGGYSKGGAEAKARRNMAKALRELAASAPGVEVLVENTAGGGSALCWRFEEVAGILVAAGDPPSAGACLDTCHMHVAGYRLDTPEAVNDVLEQFDRTVGLGRLRAMHLNDAEFAAGSRRDAHADIGKGSIGRAGFAALLGHPALASIPGVIETPKEDAGDVRNLRLLRRLRGRGGGLRG